MDEQQKDINLLRVRNELLHILHVVVPDGVKGLTEEITLSCRFSDLGADQLRVIEIVVLLEDAIEARAVSRPTTDELDLSMCDCLRTPRRVLLTAFNELEKLGIELKPWEKGDEYCREESSEDQLAVRS